MPGEDGFQLLAYCRQHADARLRTIPMLALTAYADHQSEARVLAAGFDAYLAKPAEPDDIARRIHELTHAVGGRSS
jgi:CheY-like chemotaxis protein